MLRLLNKDRKSNGQTPLFMQEDLRQVARKHSSDMAKLDYFEHENLFGQSHADRYTEARISDVVSGENLAKIKGYPHPVHRAERGLMNSPGHRKNILNPKFNCVGVGIHKSKDGTYYYTQNFAYRTLIFRKKWPKSIRIKKGLKLSFKSVAGIRSGIYRIKDASGIIKEKGFAIKPGKNELHIKFKERGLFELELFTNRKESKKLFLSNKAQIRVLGSWL